MLRSFALLFAFFAFTLAVAGQTTSGGNPQAKHTAKTATHTAARPTAIFHTTAGDLKCQLFSDKTPNTVANFIGLATGTKDWTNPATGQLEHGHPLYDGVIFHRVIPEFMVQGGDPSGTGAGDIGYAFNDELRDDLHFDRPGRLAMANRGPNTNSSQFFITEKEVPFLDPCLRDGGCPELQRGKGTGYTLFGQCDAASVELVKKMARMPCQGNTACTSQNSRPQNPVRIQHIEIVTAPKTGATKSGGAHTPAKKSTPAK